MRAEWLLAGILGGFILGVSLLVLYALLAQPLEECRPEVCRNEFGQNIECLQ